MNENMDCYMKKIISKEQTKKYGLLQEKYF